MSQRIPTGGRGSLNRQGRGCLVALGLLLAVVIVGIIVSLNWWSNRKKPVPQPSGDELQVHMLDVGQGDSILIIAPGGKVALVDAGVPGSGKVVMDAMKRYNLDHIDLMVA